MDRAQGDPCTVVRGRVGPGSTVSVDGEPAEVNAQGRFTVKPGRHAGAVIRVAVLDVAGRSAAQDVRCQEDWHPISDFSVRWGHAKAR